jgi:hypothetical protein
MKANSRNFLWLAPLLLPGALAATQTDYSAGSQAAPWLGLPMNARAAAMADVQAAIPQEADSLGKNPAGLAQLQNQELSASQNLWVQGSSVSHFAYGMSAMPNAALAVGINYENFGSIDKYTVSSAGLESAGSTNPSAYDLDLGWGQDIVAGLAAGLDLKYVNQNLDSAVSSTEAVDLGLQWMSPFDVKFGGAAQNLGGQLGGANLPANFVLGAATDFGTAGTDQSFLLGLDANIPSQGLVSVGLGAEYWMKSTLALRLGYASNNVATNDLAVSGLSAGLGLKSTWMQVDYAFSALGDLGTGNQFSLLTRF